MGKKRRTVGIILFVHTKKKKSSTLNSYPKHQWFFFAAACSSLNPKWAVKYTRAFMYKRREQKPGETNLCTEFFKTSSREQRTQKYII